MPNLNLPEYNFKRLPELGWTIFVAAAIELGQVLVKTDLALVEDWQAWGIALGTAVMVGAAKAGLAWLGRRGKFS
ncbi:hypothetical protein LCGC14_1698930 [marine sediment metagenome]|uniref:Uncharacterized protein n=1 Tax=marine sediment metagenome TaxID=412755 RepID=A0A0F9KIK6_9ZZZZ